MKRIDHIMGGEEMKYVINLAVGDQERERTADRTSRTARAVKTYHKQECPHYYCCCLSVVIIVRVWSLSSPILTNDRRDNKQEYLCVDVTRIGRTIDRLFLFRRGGVRM